MQRLNEQLAELESILNAEWDDASAQKAQEVLDAIQQRLSQEKKATESPVATTADAVTPTDAEIPAQEEKPTEEPGADHKPETDFYQRFRELKKRFQDKVKERQERDKQQHREIQKRKEEIIQELKNINADTENIQKYFGQVKKLRDEWKALPGRSDRHLQTEYSFQLESFHYHAKNFIAFRELDLKKNREQKQELIEKVNKLAEGDQIRQLEALIKQYENDWEETGPIGHEEWPAVRDQYREACKKVYDKIHAHYQELKSSQKEHAAKKEALIQGLKEIPLPTAKTPKDWESISSRIEDIQKEWNNTGFSGEKHNEYWEQFRAELNGLFRAKRDYFKGLKDNNKANRERKLKLIEEAESIQQSTDWKASTDHFLKLQQQYKQVGHSGKSQDQQLWERFRKACDIFFEAKKQHFGGRAEREEENAKKKQEILDQLKDMAAQAQSSAVMNQLQDIQNQWMDIREMNRDKNRELNQEFGRAVNLVVDVIVDMTNDEKSMAKYDLKVARMRHSGNASDLVNKEFKELKDEIQQIETEITNLENNMGFFSKSKSAGSILIEAEIKVHKLREKRDLMKRKLESLVRK